MQTCKLFIQMLSAFTLILHMFIYMYTLCLYIYIYFMYIFSCVDTCEFCFVLFNLL